MLSRPQDHSAAGTIMSIKIPLTLSGIKPATFRLVGPVQACNGIALPLLYIKNSNTNCIIHNFITNYSDVSETMCVTKLGLFYSK